MPEPVTRSYFLSVFIVVTHALLRIVLLRTGLAYTRIGRKAY